MNFYNEETMSQWQIDSQEYLDRLSLGREDFERLLKLPKTSELRKIIPLREMQHIQSVIPISYFLVCDPEMSIKRELKDAISDEVRETTNLASIKMLDGIWRTTFNIQHSFHPNLRLIDTTNLSISEMTKKIANDMLDNLEAKSKLSL